MFIDGIMFLALGVYKLLNDFVIDNIIYIQNGTGKIGFGAFNSGSEKVYVNGGIQITTAASTGEGTIEYNAAAHLFRGRDNTGWVTLSGAYSEVATKILWMDVNSTAAAETGSVSRPYKTLNAGIAAANAAAPATLMVIPGTYAGAAVVLGVGVNLIGTSSAITTITPALTTGTGSRVSGLTITGVSTLSGAGAVIEDCVLTGAQTTSAATTIRNTTCTGLLTVNSATTVEGCTLTGGVTTTAALQIRNTTSVAAATFGAAGRAVNCVFTGGLTLSAGNSQLISCTAAEIVTVSGAIVVRMEQCSITPTTNPSAGLDITAAATVYVYDSNISGTGAAAAVSMSNGTLYMYDSIISNNTAVIGTLAIAGGTEVRLNDVVATNAGAGSVITKVAAVAYLNDCTIASTTGQAIINTSGSLYARDCRITSNNVGAPTISMVAGATLELYNNFVFNALAGGSLTVTNAAAVACILLQNVFTQNVALNNNPTQANQNWVPTGTFVGTAVTFPELDYTAAGAVGVVWAVAAPTTVKTALDRIAAAVSAGVPIAAPIV